MSENQDELKVQIKAWPKQQNISRNDFAAECFVSPNTVRNWLAKVDQVWVDSILSVRLSIR